jgi:leucine dehydrogenase
MKIKQRKQAGFEEVVFCEDASSGLKAIIAIHNTKLGPALGGIRMHPYRTEKEALQDLLRLARAMSYKSAAARLNLGGGKAVIIGDPNQNKSPKLFQAMGKFVNQLKGRYYAAKDLGVVTEDLVEVAKETKFVTGLPDSMGGSGDPSTWTARSVIVGMRASAKQKMRRPDLSGVRVAVQGLGHVGFAVAKLLKKEKAKVIAADVDPEVVKRARKELAIETVAPAQVFGLTCDIFAPCAMGGVLNDETIANLRCKIVAGGANNQLQDEKKHGKQLMNKRILFAPDYIINAGGVINIYVRDILKQKNTMPWINKIESHLGEIFTCASQEHTPPSLVADAMTEERLGKPKKTRKTPK